VGQELPFDPIPKVLSGEIGEVRVISLMKF